MPHNAYSETSDTLTLNANQTQPSTVGLASVVETDNRVVARIDLPTPQATEMRRRLRMPASPDGKHLPPEVVDLLPSHSDHELAQLFGGHHSRFYRLRKELKIPAPKPDRRKPLGDDLTNQLGQVPDTTLAKQYGVSPTTIGKRRGELGIGPAGVAARIRQPGSRSKRPTGEWTAELLDLLGKVTDQEVARLSGYSRPTVTQKRVSLGIAPAGRAPGIPSEAIPLLGLYADADLARRFGGSVYQYFYHRQKRGIPAARKSRAPASGADDVLPAPDHSDSHTVSP